jgi:hypothetical protein
METECSSLCSQEPDVVFILILKNPVLTIVPYLFKILFNIILPPTAKLYKLFLPFRFSDKSLYWFLISPTRSTCAAHLILVDLITQIIYVV